MCSILTLIYHSGHFFGLCTGTYFQPMRNNPFQEVSVFQYLFPLKRILKYPFVLRLLIMFDAEHYSVIRFRTVDIDSHKPAMNSYRM